jgi:serine/threonine protein kinase
MFETLGHYKILDRVGAGTMGEVYRARDTRLGRTVAIKVLSDAFAVDEARRDRLRRDAGAMVALSHPNIAVLYEIGEDQGCLYLVFEFVPGQTLKAVIGGRPLNPRRAVEFAIEAADAVAEAHAAGIVHRDIRSENIIVTPKGHAKLLDFGLAAWTTDAVGREDPAPSELAEQTDIAALGGVLFEMIAGRPPAAGSPPPPSSMLKGVPDDVAAIVRKALAAHEGDRYASAATLGGDLRAVAAALTVRSDATPSIPIRRPTPSPSGSWIKWLLVIVVVVAGLAALVTWWR